MLNSNNNTKNYNLYAKNYLASHHAATFYEEELRKFRRFLIGRKLIDVGCGPGIHASFFINKGFDYTGVDSSAEMINKAKNNVPEGKFAVMDFNKLEFPDSHFDCFWCTEVLLHAPKDNIAKPLREIFRVVKAGAHGFITMQEKERSEDPSRGVLEEGIISHVKGGERIKRYIAFYSDEEFSKILKENGFEVKETYTKEKNKWVTFLCYFVETKRGD